jgi:hypothetical protein
MDDLGLVETVDRFGEGVVVAVADAPDRRLDASFCQPLGLANGHVLNAAVRVMYEATPMNGASFMKCLLTGDKPCMCRPACPPADDATSEDVDYVRANAQHLSRGHVDETLPSGEIGKVRNP